MFFVSFIPRTAGAIILRISHGYTVQEKEDPFVTLADEATEQFALSTAPGGFLVNLIPPREFSFSLFLEQTSINTVTPNFAFQCNTFRLGFPVQASKKPQKNGPTHLRR